MCHVPKKNLFSINYFRKLTFKAHRCPDCTRARKLHCVHQATFRNNNTVVVRQRQRPSAVRDELCARMWGGVIHGGDKDAARMVQEMQARAHAATTGEADTE